MTPATLLDYVWEIEDDSELVDYLVAFVGDDDGVMSFALELCQRRRAVG